MDSECLGILIVKKEQSGDTMFAHIHGPAAQRPADAWITTAALHITGVLFCCAACLEVSRALEESPTLHRGPQARRVNTTTTLLVAPARTQTCSRVQSICRRRHVSPSPAPMSFAPIACMHAFCRTTAGSSQILPKSSCLASQGTYPWSASVESVILGVLNASLPSQSPELDFQPLEFENWPATLTTCPVPNHLMII